MAQRYWENLDYLRASIGRAGALGGLCFSLAVIFAALGVIADAANVKIGLNACSWLLLAIVVAVLSETFYIGWALAWYVKTAA